MDERIEIDKEKDDCYIDQHTTLVSIGKKSVSSCNYKSCKNGTRFEALSDCYKIERGYKITLSSFDRRDFSLWSSIEEILRLN